MEAGIRQRIGDGDADIVGLSIANHADGGFDVFPLLAQVAELEEHAGADAVAAQVFARLANLFHANAFLHGVQNALRAGLRAHPYFDAACPCERLHRVARHQVAPGLHAERNSRLALLHARCKFARPLPPRGRKCHRRTRADPG